MSYQYARLQDYLETGLEISKSTPVRGMHKQVCCPHCRGQVMPIEYVKEQGENRFFYIGFCCYFCNVLWPGARVGENKVPNSISYAKVIAEIARQQQ